ncbi:MAG: DUF554 domain-containing protein [Clostridiales bacterium]|nr:DUF554 domain-containing protein [Clostridiales bacterium]
MLGVIVNFFAILAGGAAGLIIRGGLKEKYRETVMHAVSMAVLFIGASGAIGKLTLPEANPVLFVISLVIGGVVGEAADLDAKLNALGEFLQRKLGGVNAERALPGGGLAQGFVYASLIYCVGTMAILGSIESALGSHATLLAKSVLDGVTAVVFASTLGAGVLLSAVSVAAYQGLLVLLASVITPHLSADMLREISIVGGILISTLGLNMLGVVKIKSANLLPAIIVPVVYYSLYTSYS